MFIAQEIPNEDLCIFVCLFFSQICLYSPCLECFVNITCLNCVSCLHFKHGYLLDHSEEWDYGVFADGQRLSSISLYSCVCGDYYFPSAEPMALNLYCELTEFYYRLRSLFLLILPSSHLLFLFQI